MKPFCTFSDFLTVGPVGDFIGCLLSTWSRVEVIASSRQFRPPIALRIDLSHITTELWETPVLRMAH